MLVEAGIDSWGSKATVPIVIALAHFTMLAMVERRVAYPVLLPPLLALPKVRAAMVVRAISCHAYFGGRLRESMDTADLRERTVEGAGSSVSR